MTTHHLDSQTAGADARATGRRRALWAILQTDLGWFGLGRVRKTADRIILESTLGEAPRALVSRVVKRTRLWRHEQAEVARELVAHFEDGLASGRAERDLLASFGDEHAAARLIRRAMRRKRSFLWHVWLRAWQAVGATIILVVAAYLFLGLRVWMAAPSIKRNFLAELNSAALAVPEQDRAWPLIREAILARTELPEVPSTFVEGALDTLETHLDNPESPHWPRVIEYLKENERALDLLRAAAERPRVGYVIGRDEDAEWVAKTGPDMAAACIPRMEDNPELMDVWLPLVGVGSRLCGMLDADMLRAAEEGDGERVVENLRAALRLADGVGEAPLLICALVSTATANRSLEAVAQIAHRWSDALTDDQWRDAAHLIAPLDPESRIAGGFNWERAIIEDFLQRYFSDDGRGGGVLTIDGADYFLASSSGTDDRRARRWAARFVGPAAAVMVADRRDQLAMCDRLLLFEQGCLARPLWDQPEPSQREEIWRELDAGIERTRYEPLNTLLPSMAPPVVMAKKSVMLRDATLAAIALELFRRREGMYPETIERLVPAFMPVVPRDAFTGGSMGYVVRDGRPILYSVGTDLDDDQGRALSVDCNRWKPLPPWKHPTDVERLKREDPKRIPDGDWIIFPSAL